MWLAGVAAGFVKTSQFTGVGDVLNTKGPPVRAFCIGHCCVSCTWEEMS